MATIDKNIENPERLSRRGFLGLAGLAGAGLAGGALLSACSPAQSADAENVDSGNNASADSSASSTNTDPIAPVEAPAEWTEEADVIVCGSGGGLVAALRSAQLGNKVIVLEKATSWGGTSKETDIYSVMGSKTQQAIYAATAEQLTAAGQVEAAAQLDQLAQVPPEMMCQQWFAKYLPQPGNGDEGELPDGTTGIRAISGDPELIMAVCNGVADAADWLGEVGVPWGPVTMMGSAGMVAGLCPHGSEEGGFVARSNYSIFELLYNSCLEAGVSIYFETPADALVTGSNGEVLGVKSGESYYKGNKGVVMATGGMAQNTDMLKRYVPSVADRAFNSCAAPEDTGEGILMTWGVGAAMLGYDASFDFDGGVDCGTWNRYLYKGDVQLARQPWLGINSKGKRYPYYPVDTLGFTRQSGLLMSQADHRGLVIFDANYEQTLRTWYETGKNQLICRNPIWPDMPVGDNFDRLPESKCEHDWRIGAQQALDGGWLFECNTLEELAEKLGIEAELLTTAVDNWNAICEAGIDEQWHFDPAWLVPIKDAPYYGMAVGATCLSTNCGASVTPHMEVVSTTGAIIKGLYAVGCTIGGIGGDSTYGDCRNPGGGVGLTCGSAYIAANAIG